MRDETCGHSSTFTFSRQRATKEHADQGGGEQSNSLGRGCALTQRAQKICPSPRSPSQKSALSTRPLTNSSNTHTTMRTSQATPSHHPPRFHIGFHSQLLYTHRNRNCSKPTALNRSSRSLSHSPIHLSLSRKGEVIAFTTSFPHSNTTKSIALCAAIPSACRAVVWGATRSHRAKSVAAQRASVHHTEVWPVGRSVGRSTRGEIPSNRIIIESSLFCLV